MSLKQLLIEFPHYCYLEPNVSSLGQTVKLQNMAWDDFGSWCIRCMPSCTAKFWRKLMGFICTSLWHLGSSKTVLFQILLWHSRWRLGNKPSPDAGCSFGKLARREKPHSKQHKETISYSDNLICGNEAGPQSEVNCSFRVQVRVPSNQNWRNFSIKTTHTIKWPLCFTTRQGNSPQGSQLSLD